MRRLQLSDLAILVVEPSGTQHNVLARYLREAGVTKIDFVGSGVDAQNSIARSRPDLIISAFYLPDMSSDQLLETLRHTEKTAHIPFILVSSETRFERLDPLRQAGVTAILNKPFTAKDLLAALQHTLDHLEGSEIELEHFDPADIRVLVVDDSPLARKHTRHILMEMGMQHFTEADDGTAAIKLLASQEFDLVVTDLNMPTMDGEELVRYIRNSEHSFVPILMITSEQNQSRLAAIQQAGVSAICDKPFEPQGLRNALVRMLNG